MDKIIRITIDEHHYEVAPCGNGLWDSYDVAEDGQPSRSRDIAVGVPLAPTVCLLMELAAGVECLTPELRDMAGSEHFPFLKRIRGQAYPRACPGLDDRKENR